MSISEKDARIRWEDERERDLWDFMRRRLRDGLSITAALKEYGDKNGMSWLTARWKYYQIRGRQGGESPASPPEDRPDKERTRRRKETSQDEFLSYLTDLVEGSAQSGEDIVPMMKGLSRLAMLSSEGIRLRESLRERERLAASAVSDAKKASAERDRAQDTLRALCAFLQEWLELPPVEKVGSLKEFSERLRAEIDSAMAN
jgi:hypothetical protein